MRRTALLPFRAAPSSSRPRPTFRTRPAFLTPRGVRRLTSAIPAADVQFGQPLHETHPHLLKAGELTPGITALEYHHRRAALARKLPRNSIAVLAANELKYKSGAVFYEFHQEPNFFYLTGFNEPEALAVIEKGRSDVEYTFHLFLRPKDAQAEVWDGARSGVQAARDVFNADEACDISSLSANLSPLIRDAKEVYTDIGSMDKKSATSRFFAGLSTPVDGFAKLLQKSSVRPLRPLMNELRVIKSAAELDCMRLAGAASGAVLTDAMRQSYTTEKQLWADVAHGFKTRGLDGEAYVPVVAGGTNALSIHYVRNDAALTPGSLVLVDAGGAYGGYMADITRTWAVGGKFTDAQRDLYAMVLEVQETCIAACRASAGETLDGLHRLAEARLRDGLRALGFDISSRRGPDALDALFPHHVGHHVGLDVHDAPGYSRSTPLREDMCVTVEPGVYVGAGDERWPAAFRGLGVRIEDSVRVGKDEVEVLTRAAVKGVHEMEALRGK